MIKSLANKIRTMSFLNLATLLFVVTFIFYSNTLLNGLFFDDQQFIYNNPVVVNFDLPHIFGQSLATAGGHLSNYYRPILFLGFSIEYFLFKDFGGVYHFDSLLIHIAGGLILFLILEKIFKNRLLSTLTVLLFLIHPIQTEAVSYASGRGDPLSFFFVMLTLYLSFSSNVKSSIISYFTLICALLSKEMALVAPLLIVLIHIFIQKEWSKKNVIQVIKKSIPYFLIAGLYFLLRITIFNFSDTLNFYQASNAYSSSLFVRLITFFHLFPKYLSLLVFPKDLFMERDYGINIQTTFTLSAVMTILGSILCFIFAWWKRKKYPMVLFGLLWIVITFLPTCGIIPINGIFYEHFLYYPSVGFFLIFSFAVITLAEHLPAYGKTALSLLLCLLILVLGVRTFMRNLEWHDPVIFYTQTLAHVQSPRAYNNLAMAYADRGEDRKAIPMYQKAIQLSNAYAETHYDLGNAYVHINDVKDAEKEYYAALHIDPSFYFAYVQLYRLYKVTHNDQSLDLLKTTLSNLGKQNKNYLILLHELEQEP